MARRARGLHNEYVAKARAVDEQYAGAAPGTDGPVTRRLLSYGHVRGLVFGSWGEASEDVEHLLSEVAQTGARARWRSMGCPDVAAAVGCLAWMLRRRWGIAALRENARLKLERMAYVGRGAIHAAARRQRSELEHATRARLLQARQHYAVRRR